MQYKIVNVDSVLFLEQRVAHYISEGWIPQGGVCVITEDELNCHIRRYIQAMIKNEGQMFSTIYNPPIKKPLFKHNRQDKTRSRKAKLLMAELQAYIQYEIDMEILNEAQMTQLPPMSNEQFALWIASVKYSVSRDVISIADKYYEWLESKKPKQAEIKHYLNGVEVPEPYWDQLNKIQDRWDT